MAISDELFDLVKSLSSSEKRYVRLYSNFQRKERDFLLLFDAIEKSKSYDENAIRRAFKNKPSALRRISYIKRYLYEHILKSLNSYYYSNSLISVVKSNLDGMEVLYKKGLYKQCFSLVKSTKKICIENHFLPQLIETIDWQIQIDHKIRNIRTSSEREGILTESKRAMDDLCNIHTATVLMMDFVEVHREVFRSREASSKASGQLEVLINRPIIKVLKDSKNFKELYLYNFIYSIYHRTRGEYDLFLEYCELNVSHFKSNQLWMEREPELFKNAVSDLIFGKIDTGKFNGALIDLSLFQEIPEITNLKDTKSFLSDSYYLELHLLKNIVNVGLGRFSESYRLAELAKKELKPWFENDEESIVIRVAVISLNNAIISLALEEFKSALFWINKIVNRKSTHLIKEDVYCQALLFNLIIHSELKNNNLLEYRFRSVYYHLKNKTVLFEWEQILLGHLKKLPVMSNEKELNVLFHNLYNELKAFEREHNTNLNSPQYIQIVSWVESKVKGESFKECLTAGMSKLISD